MGFFSGVRRKIKKLIPKELRPFIPYAAAMIPGMAALGPIGGAFTKASLARLATDDEADLKDALRAGALAAAPAAINKGVASLAGTTNAAGDPTAIANFLNKGREVGETGKTMSLARSIEGKLNPSGIMGQAKMIGAQGGIDYGIKAAELNEDALAEYNRMMAEQGINDRAGRRSAIRKIYENTGTWDMDEVDSMLDTYGYRTGGRVGYAMGDRVDTDQIIEDFRRIPSIGKGIGNLARAGVDNIDKIIEVIIKTNPILATGDKIVEILVERYGVDPAVAQRKVINRMSDSNEGFGPQGPQGTPDDGYNPNIGIDSGAEDYYGETPAMPENLGDMGGNMDDMSGNSILNRLRRGQEIMPRPDRLPPIPMPEMQPDPDRLPPVPMPTMPRDPRYFDMEREPFKRGGFSDDEYSNFMESFESAGEGLDKLKELDEEEEFLPIRELRLQDGGSVDDRLMERVKELQDEGLDFASALAQAMKEDMASGKAMGGIMDGIDINMREQIDTPRGDMMIDENIKVADSSLMDAYEIYKFDMMEQGLEPMSLEQFRDQAMAEGKMANMDYREFIYDASRDNFANDMFGKDYGDLNEQETEEVDAIIEMELGKNQAAPERTMAASGGLMNLGGREMDLRGGGFVPMGAKERADDVPARLSKNEFVMTADAVRAAGGGSVQKGADLMYDQMKQLEGQA